jgi:hypothetical protein
MSARLRNDDREPAVLDVAARPFLLCLLLAYILAAAGLLAGALL